MKGIQKALLGTMVAGLAATAVPSAAAASTADTAAKKGWKSTGYTTPGGKDKDGVDVYAGRYWSGNKRVNARGYFQSYGEVFYAYNNTSTTATIEFKVNGKVRRSYTLGKGETAQKNDSFGEGKSVSLTVCVKNRGCALYNGGVS